MSRKHINQKIKEKARQYTASREYIRRSTENEIKLLNQKDFFDKINKPTNSKLYDFVELVKTTSEEMLDKNGISRIIEIDPYSNKWRWKNITTTAQLKEAIVKSEAAHSKFMKVREHALMKFLGKEDDFDGINGLTTPNGFPVRPEFDPVIGTPFYKQLYLYDYWLMHSEAFYWSNYSGIGKLIVDITRNFVMGRGFNVSCKSEDHQDAWEKYAERTNIIEESRFWCDDLTKFGEVMIKRVPTTNGILHKSFDPSTIWEIVTDPENISDIKYYHQQYNTQYQLYSTPTAPVAKYIIQQLPPELVIHSRVNVTPYEKRGRSDLLSAMLYFKYYEDYMQAKLIRSKNEAAFIWDVTIDGSDDDVMFYINNTQSIADVPPGSENVHNDMVKREPLSPQFGAVGREDTASEILSYIAMSVNIPFNYFGTHATAGSTKAGALVATEPVAKKMIERQLKMEMLLRVIVKDVFKDAGLDPKEDFEINWPEIMEEDSTTKIANIIMAKQQNAIAHQTMSEMLSKELKITKYDYQNEIKLIQQEMRNPALFDAPDLTPQGNGADNNNDRSIDRTQTKKDNLDY